MEGNTVTVNTAMGPLQATIGADTSIILFQEGAAGDLAQGAQVIVIGQRGADGTVTARSIVVTPEGSDWVLPIGGRLGGRVPLPTPGE